MSQEELHIAIIGSGPAGLMAAEAILERGLLPDLFEAKPSAGRRLLVAGKGGLNLTHSEAYSELLARYGSSSEQLKPFLDDFGPDALRAWVTGLGFETFTGSSGRVFPQGMQAAPLLRAWVERLKAGGTRIHTRSRWLGWEENGNLRFSTEAGEAEVHADAVVLALGGTSWPQLGADGSWVSLLQSKGVGVAPLRAANCGFNVIWTRHFIVKYSGQPVKSVRLRFVDSLGNEFDRRGEFVASSYGLEGSLVYAVSALLRDELERKSQVTIHLDLAPDFTVEQLAARLARWRGPRSLSSHLERQAGIAGVKAGLLWEFAPAGAPADPQRLAETIKALPIQVESPRPLEEAISTAGGVPFDELDEQLMLRKLPGVFCSGEMLDWEAPTGGYLLTACFATGRAAGLGASAWLAKTGRN